MGLPGRVRDGTAGLQGEATLSVTAISRAVVALSLALAAAVVAAPAATAYASTTCTGTLSHVTVVGDLIVPGEAVCTIDHVLVTGSLLLVGDAASARVTSSEVRGTVSVGRWASLSADAVTFGDVSVFNTEHLDVSRATVRGDVRGSTRTLRLDRVLVADDLVVREGDSGFGNLAVVSLEQTTVRGKVDSDGLAFYGSGLTVGEFVRILYANLPGQLERLAGSLCGLDVGGDVRIEESGWIFAVGAHPYGDPVGCDPAATPSTVGSLTLVDNRHSIAVAAVTVAGDLVCTGNTGPRGVAVADDVVVGGRRLGQCA
jgi:hypothetical protein